jgi:phosphopantothenoylcysteine decarboxylase / phosphopantothenate---cysteine ligase
MLGYILSKTDISMKNHENPVQNWIKRHLASANLSAAAASAKAGLGKGVVGDILSGKSANPGIETLAAIARALDCELTDLIAGTRASSGSLGGRTILLVIGGGIAAYKSLDLIRRLRERGAIVRAVMTKAAQEFVTPLSVGALTGGKVFTELFDQDDEHDVGHVRLAREADAVVVAPATADLIARMASASSGRTPARWRRPARREPAAWPSRWRSPPRSRRCSAAGLRAVMYW